MLPVLLTAQTEIDKEIGFRYRAVYVETEGSALHHHDYYEIFLTLSDDVHHEINGTHQRLPKGTLVFIRKGDVHYYHSSPTNTISFINFAFTEEVLLELFAFLTEGFGSKDLLDAATPPCVQLSDKDIAWVVRQLEDLNATDMGNIPQKKYHSRTLLFKIFTRFFSQYAGTDRQTADLSIPPWMLALNTQMQKLENFSQGAARMVELSGKCRAHLGRVVKQYYNKTIPEYINDLRLNYWANTLLSSDAPILELCYECGFENVSWAYSLFKKKYGTTPSDFRKHNT